MLRALVLVALVFMPASILAQTPATGTNQPGQIPQQPARDNTAKTGTSVIKGHVSAADTGQPLRKAMIRAFSPELRETRMTTTDADGNFELKELPAGRYNLNASKGGYVGLSYGQTRPFEAGKPLEVPDGRTLEKVDFSLPRGGVVTGRIVDEFGDPVSDVQVAIMRYQYIQGRRRLTPAGRPSMTDDIGQFRVFGLPPGQYYLAATLRTFSMGENDDRSGYAPTYYPGTGDVASAQKLSIGLGQTISDINMALASTRTAKISGTVTGTDGRPMTTGYVMMYQRTGMMMSGSSGAQIKPDGSFTVSNVAPGEYTLQAGTGGPFTEDESAVAHVTVTGQDITGLALTAQKPSIAHGRLVVPDSSDAGSLRPSSVRLFVEPLNSDDGFMMGGGMGKVNDDGTFEIKARAGTAVIRLGMMIPGWSLKAVRQNGADVTDSGIEFRSNETVEGLEVELTNHPSEVSGAVTDDQDKPVKDYAVVIFPQDRERWTNTSRYFGMGRPDQDGRYKASSLPAGEYYAIALEYVDQGDARDPDFLDRIKDRATRFRLGDGESKALDLKLQRIE
jgi:hypothetical protein